MKKTILLIALILTCSIQAQELKLNEGTRLYAFEEKSSSIINIEKAVSNIKSVGYEQTDATADLNIFRNKFSYMVMGNFPVVINYKLVLKYSEKGIEYSMTNFTVNDQNNMIVPLEDLGSYQKKWIKNINKKLPDLISQLNFCFK